MALMNNEAIRAAYVNDVANAIKERGMNNGLAARNKVNKRSRHGDLFNVWRWHPNRKIAAECYILFQIDTSTKDKNEDGCLEDGVYNVDGDETASALTAGYMCAKGWRGKTRFSPSGIKTYVMEYDHNPPSNFVEGRGTQSGAHMDIMGNFQLIDVL